MSSGVTPGPVSPFQVGVIDVTAIAEEAGFGLRRVSHEEVAWSDGQGLRRLTLEEADWADGEVPGEVVPIHITTLVEAALREAAPDEASFRAHLARLLHAARPRIQEELVQGSSWRTSVPLQLPDRVAEGRALLVTTSGLFPTGLCIGWGPRDLWSGAASMDTPADELPGEGDSSSFHYEGPDAFARGFCVITALMLALIVVFIWPLAAALLALAAALVVPGLRASITVEPGRAVVDRRCWGLPYSRHEGPVLEDVALGGDWGLSTDGLGVFVTIGGREIGVGSRGDATSLYEQLRKLAQTGAWTGAGDPCPAQRARR